MTDTDQDKRPLAGRLAIVTGASRGIGAATAHALAADGAHVVLVARSVPDLEAVEEAIHAAGGSATIAPLDLTDGESIGRLAQAVGGRWQALDILVLNAATLGTLAAVPAIDVKEFARQLTLNVAAPQALIAAFDPMLRASKDARVIALSTGVAATNPRAYWGAYGASKAALDVLVAAYGKEVSKISAIRTHIVDPGATRTTMRARAYPGEDPATLKTPDVVGRAIADLVASDAEDGARIVLPK
ncbi:SDR family NAD(P)-dependent oxidoreductase [Sphingobium nicotianae]|uniref:SDR family NAD(P)-dependent oxidoreductase n=1 Tax=Sphingobium nicotianae TaxID=2782607 RepID=A0A9X1AJ44_9SPHN|nr:SDR family NAD(P)-dependent oxidoreductase [Sphingobium nicotianae]MBT2185774.1 SDR family NAD(P)-dependent oxidoreductase [Sphingobium nicotianae]